MEEGDKLEPRYPPVNIPRSEDRGDAMERVDARRSFLPSNRYIFPPISIYRSTIYLSRGKTSLKSRHSVRAQFFQLSRLIERGVQRAFESGDVVAETWRGSRKMGKRIFLGREREKKRYRWRRS